MMNSGQGTMGSVLGNGRRALAEEVPVGYKRTEVGVFDARVEGYLKQMGLSLLIEKRTIYGTLGCEFK